MFIINMSCGNPNTNRDDKLYRQLQKEEYNISSNSNLANKYQEIYDKDTEIYGFDPVFDKVRNAERRKILSQSEKIHEKIIDNPKPVVVKETSIKSIFINFSQTILNLSPFIFLFIIIVLYCIHLKKR